MGWPYRRFRTAYDAWERRKLVEHWDQRKIAHISATYANTNFDSQENDRPAEIQRLEREYENIKAIIWDPESMTVSDEEMDTDFMRASKRAVARQLPSPQLPGEEAFSRLPD